MLHVTAVPDHHIDMGRELSAIKGAITAPLTRELRPLQPLWTRFRFRAMMPLGPARRTLDDELHELNDLADGAFRKMTAEAIYGTRLPNGFSLDNPDDEHWFIAECRKKSDSREELAIHLLQDPHSLRRRLLELIGRCRIAFFDSRWKNLEPVLLDRAEHIQESIGQSNVAAALETFIDGTHLLPDSSQVVFDKLQSAVVDVREQDVVLIPSWWTHPHVVVKYDREYGRTQVPLVVQFAAQSPRSTDLSLALIRQQMIVLSDATRLDLCRHLVNDEYTTTELANRTRMSAPQVSRHLTRLREVGLVDSTREGKMVKHRLRTDAVYSMGLDFLRLLTR